MLISFVLYLYIVRAVQWEFAYAQILVVWPLSRPSMYSFVNILVTTEGKSCVNGCACVHQCAYYYVTIVWANKETLNLLEMVIKIGIQNYGHIACDHASKTTQLCGLAMHIVSHVMGFNNIIYELDFNWEEQSSPTFDLRWSVSSVVCGYK